MTGRRYSFERNRSYEVRCSDGQLVVRNDYRGWRLDEGTVLHQFGAGRRDRVFVEDAEIRSVVVR